ncbi:MULTISPECIES: enoyl-CoA hydratase-related protein [Cryobacterium]|uniref:enoyl-CoA hydratase-related protein n=1 Tax=Cryobacterium TaxID=69578 RepID=UPI0021069D1F|nr:MULTISPECIES: enoyl-CoA hydratase-related protein [Cryobacterium]
MNQKFRAAPGADPIDVKGDVHADFRTHQAGNTATATASTGSGDDHDHGWNHGEERTVTQDMRVSHDGVVRVEQFGHVLLITLNRPEARNAINPELTLALGEAVEAFDADPDLRVAVITGAGSAFCAGQDLKNLASGGSVTPTHRPEWASPGSFATSRRSR